MVTYMLGEIRGLGEGSANDIASGNRQTIMRDSAQSSLVTMRALEGLQARMRALVNGQRARYCESLPAAWSITDVRFYKET